MHFSVVQRYKSTTLQSYSKLSSHRELRLDAEFNSDAGAIILTHNRKKLRVYALTCKHLISMELKEIKAFSFQIMDLDSEDEDLLALTSVLKRRIRIRILRKTKKKRSVWVKTYFQ